MLEKKAMALNYMLDYKNKYILTTMSDKQTNIVWKQELGHLTDWKKIQY